jgi:hypothetical protein
MQWLRKAAEMGVAEACEKLGIHMYMDIPYAREVGLVVEAAGVSTSVGFMEGHDVPSGVLTGVVHWLRMGEDHVVVHLYNLRTVTLEGSPYCHNNVCEVVGQRKDFKVCPQCKTARYCGAACQKEDWTTGGHKDTCGTFHADR